MKSTVKIFDTTLRDGTQGEGISLSVEDKLKIALKLDALGVTYIEGGWPGSNNKDIEFFNRVKDLPLKHAKITAFGKDSPQGHTPRRRCEFEPDSRGRRFRCHHLRQVVGFPCT